MKKLKRLVYWLLVNAGLLGCTIYGVRGGATWALNIVSFAIPVLAVLATLGAIGATLGAIGANQKELQAELRAKAAERVMPSWVGLTVDLIVTLVLASAGHFALASAMVWSVAMGAAYHAAVNKPETEEPAK